MPALKLPRDKLLKRMTAGVAITVATVGIYIAIDIGRAAYIKKLVDDTIDHEGYKPVELRNGAAWWVAAGMIRCDEPKAPRDLYSGTGAARAFELTPLAYQPAIP